MKRRKFLKYSGILIGSSTMLTSCHSSMKKLKKTELKAFIVSDAHIGWRNKDQPTIEQQKISIEAILKSFPDLDLAFDTGDVHHGYLNETERNVARSQWLKNIANQFSTIPFHYIPGNHELGKGEDDPEIVASDFGSIPLRPYYAFDCMGIHFISLPQLLSTILITKETINWLKLDLKINQNKTTIILSHNSIKGTTYNNGETGYRCLANSEEILEILDNNPQIVAWFHGHNHQYEIVKLQNRVYVSNGRIGGFNPPKEWGDFGQGHLGGIYFEISNSKIIIKAYSATENKILSDIGFDNLSIELETNTSFNADSKFNYYCGHGKSTNSIQYNVNNHYITEHQPTLIYQTVNDSINENTDLNIPTNFFFANKTVNKIIGYKLNNKDILFKLENNNLSIHNPKLIKSFNLFFPTFKNKKHKLYKRGGYYRCASNQSYQVVIKTSEDLLESKLDLTATVLDYNYNKIDSISPKNQAVLNNRMTFVLETRDYSESPPQTYITFDLKFQNFPKQFTINSIEFNILKQAKSDKSLFIQNKNNFKINPQPLAQITQLNQINEYSDTVQLNRIDDNVVCWLIKYSNIQWQIRNGVGYLKDETLFISGNQSRYHASKKIIITPTEELNFFLNWVKNTKEIQVSYPDLSRCIIILQELDENIDLKFCALKEPKLISGADLIKTETNGFIINAKNKRIEVII